MDVCSDLPSSQRHALVQERAGEGPRRAKGVLQAGLVLWVQCVWSHGLRTQKGLGLGFMVSCHCPKFLIIF